MTGLVFLADPPDRKHLRLVIELSGPAEQIFFWDQRGLGVVRLVSPEEFDAIYGPAKIGPDALEISAAELRRRMGRSTPGDQSRIARSKGTGRRGKSLCLGNPASGRHPSGPAVPAVAEGPVAAGPRRDAPRAARRDPTPRFDAPRRHLSHRPRCAGQLPVQSSRLSAARANVSRLRESPDRSDRAGPAIDVLLSGVPARVTKLSKTGLPTPRGPYQGRRTVRGTI